MKKASTKKIRGKTQNERAFLRTKRAFSGTKWTTRKRSPKVKAKFTKIK
jgi:hypothetical protein